MNRQTLLERARGCLIGLACGDAMGDLGRNDTYRRRYGIVTNIYSDARSTDDTEFALLVARILLDCGGRLDRQAVLDGWKKYILGQGGMFDRGGAPLYGAVENLRRGLLPPFSGEYNVANVDDGAAMRVAAIGIVNAGKPSRAAAEAEIDAQISHARDGIWAAQAVAASIATAMTGAPVDEIIASGTSYIPSGSWLGYCMDKALDYCARAERIEDIWEALHSELWTPSHSSAAEAIPQAYAVYKMTQGDLQSGMMWACNFGRDADTIGAVVGALIGARSGIGIFPENWIEQVRRPAGVCLRFAAQEDVLRLAGELVELIDHEQE